ncbi:MAG: class I tRNA ligase family protein, partial [Minisyncoccia bacterium]
DTLRVYEMFMGPFTDAIAWKTSSLIGARRFLERTWRLQEKLQKETNTDVDRVLHQTIKKVGDDIRNFKFNTAISQMMIFLNEAEKGITKSQFQSFVALLAPFAPHIAEELWNVLGKKSSIHTTPWPKHDESKLATDTVTIVVQINGKVRAQITAAMNSTEAAIDKVARLSVAKWLEGKNMKKVVFVQNRLINFVID